MSAVLFFPEFVGTRRGDGAQPGTATQHPVTHASPVGQSGRQLAPQGVTPAGQLGGEHAVEPAQLAGKVRLPKQSSHVSQGFEQPWTNVHGLQRVGSSRCE